MSISSQIIWFKIVQFYSNFHDNRIFYIHTSVSTLVEMVTFGQNQAITLYENKGVMYHLNRSYSRHVPKNKIRQNNARNAFTVIFCCVCDARNLCRFINVIAPLLSGYLCTTDVVMSASKTFVRENGYCRWESSCNLGEICL